MMLSKEAGRRVVYKDHEDWITIEESVIDNTRWSIIKEGVFMHIPTGTHYGMSWSVGATESQEEQPFEYENPEPYEVIKVEKVIETWEPV